MSLDEISSLNDAVKLGLEGFALAYSKSAFPERKHIDSLATKYIDYFVGDQINMSKPELMIYYGQKRQEYCNVKTNIR